MKTYLSFCDRLNRIAVMLSALFLVATVVICFMQVATRTAYSFSFRWAEEITRYIVIFAVFFASGALIANDEHPRVEILVEYLSKKNRLRLNYLYYALIFAFLCILTYYGWQLVATSTRTYCSSIRMPWAVPFASVFIGGVNMLVQVPARAMKNHLAILELEKGENGT